MIEKSVQKDVLNLSELANYLQLSEKDVFSLLAEIPHVELAGKLRFQLNSIKSWLHQKENKQLSNKKNNIIQFQDFLVRNVI
ncbi:helix-turn-helix domain-containing protein [bacterium]|nr:helix-turn-helix domain-containing protein [bacterium]